MVIVGKVPEAVGALKLVLLASIVKDSKLSPIFNAASNLEFDKRTKTREHLPSYVQDFIDPSNYFLIKTVQLATAIFASTSEPNQSLASRDRFHQFLQFITKYAHAECSDLEFLSFPNLFKESFE